MAVIRYEPFRDPFERLISMAATGTRAPLGMPMDVYRAEDGSYHIEADLPGVDPDSVEVTVEHGTLTIRAERTPHYGESEQVIVAERPQGSFTRQLTLGEGVDSENLTAGYADGVLHVTIPASPKAQARRVEITRAPAAAARSRAAQPSRVSRPPEPRSPTPAEPPRAISGQPVAPRAVPRRPGGDLTRKPAGQLVLRKERLDCRRATGPDAHEAVILPCPATARRHHRQVGVQPNGGQPHGGSRRRMHRACNDGESRSDDRVEGEHRIRRCNLPESRTLLRDGPRPAAAKPSPMGH